MAAQDPPRSGRDFGVVDAAIGTTDPEDIDFERRYGPWQALSIPEAVDALADFGSPWWVCGGQAIEAFTGVRRPHDDLDIGFFRRDLDALKAALAPAYDVWSVGSGMLRPLNDRFPELHEESEQVWIRAHAWAPWRLDLLATPDDDGRWVNKREPDEPGLPLDEVTWRDGDGVRHLAPELALAMKARLDRPKDRADLEATLPLLSDTSRNRLRTFVERHHPGHAWLVLLGPVRGGGSRTA